jgi:hypothetical protein
MRCSLRTVHSVLSDEKKVSIAALSQNITRSAHRADDAVVGHEPLDCRWYIGCRDRNDAVAHRAGLVALPLARADAPSAAARLLGQSALQLIKNQFAMLLERAEACLKCMEHRVRHLGALTRVERVLDP